MNCPGCGARSVTRQFSARDRLFGMTAREFSMERCRDCGLEFLWPCPTPEELREYYPADYWTAPSPLRGWRGLLASLTEAYRRLVLRDHVRFVRRIVRTQQAGGTWRRLLDVGCGDGSLLQALQVPQCVGLDISREAVRAVRMRGMTAACGRLEAAPFAAGSFSVITMFHYLEHVPSAGTVLSAVRRLLTPEGRLVVQVPNVDCWQRRLLGERWAGYDPPRHLINYSTATLCATLLRQGFHVETLTHYALRDNSAAMAMSLAPRFYPPVRVTRRAGQTGVADSLASLAFLSLVLGCLPFSLVESAFGHGASVMVEAARA